MATRKSSKRSSKKKSRKRSPSKRSRGPVVNKKTLRRVGRALAAHSKKRSSKKSAKKSGGLNAKLRPSASLAAIVGPTAQTRGSVTKKLWSYIKRHKLQVPSNMRMIKPDAKLAKVFGGKSAISMFAMTKKVSKHLS